ncbi:hypothetical protein PIB30_012956 [Stylosanthes scabra]|uniref:RNase H type-1 domain-containing protein n=1 Tax=Stylosanthes scabra TaxID=79078 RepID=A0ABU6Z359_9FABA|nr:hypothetical protein [Stylosanthes scabra]
MAINFIKDDNNSSHPCSSLFQDINILTSRIPNIHWCHILHEANSTANILAKKGQDLPSGLHLFDAPPLDISNSFFLDGLGCFRHKGIAKISISADTCDGEANGETCEIPTRTGTHPDE